MKNTIETLRTENKQLLILSEKLVKECNKMMKTNVNGAKLLFNRIEEVNAKRQDLNSQIVALTA